MAQTLRPQRYRGFVLTDGGLQKLQARIQQLETQTRLRQTPRILAERVQLNHAQGIHPITVRKILGGQHGVDKRSMQLVFQVLQLALEAGDYVHAGLAQSHFEPLVDDQPSDREPTVIGLYGRQTEFRQLTHAILTDRYRLIQIVGQAGIGKTALATQLVQQIQPEFDAVVWKACHHAPDIRLMLTNLLQSLLQSLGQQTASALDLPCPVELPTAVEVLMGWLIELLQTHRCLLILDHFNAVFSGRQYAGHYAPGYEAYGDLIDLIAKVPHQSCVVITSREQPQLVGLTEDLARYSLPLGGIDAAEFLRLGQATDLVGTPADWQLFSEQSHGNPLVLKLLAHHIRNYFGGYIEPYLNWYQSSRLISDLRDLLDQQFTRLSGIEQELVNCLARQQQEVSLAQLQQSLPTLDPGGLLEGLDSLRRRSLLIAESGGFRLDPLLKRYLSWNWREAIPPGRPRLQAVLPKEPTPKAVNPESIAMGMNPELAS